MSQHNTLWKEQRAAYLARIRDLEYKLARTEGALERVNQGLDRLAAALADDPIEENDR